MNDAYTSNNYVARVEEAFAPVIAEGALRIGAAEFSAHHFGSFLLEFNGDCVRIRVVRDRKQFLVDFAPPRTEEWIDDETVWQLIGADEVNEQRSRLDLRSLDQVAEATTSHFSTICALFTASEVTESLGRANAYRRARAKRLFGYEPPMVNDGG